MVKRIVVRCNIDNYRHAFSGFNAGGFLPAVGHMIAVEPEFINQLERKQLPTALQVQSITHECDRIVIEVHLSINQAAMLRIANINAFA